MSIIVAILFVLLGLAIKNGKMYYLIAGYNTMPQEEQEKYDIEGIATVFRNVMFGMSFFLILGYVTSKGLENPKIEVYVMVGAVIIGIAYLLVVTNSSKYKIKK